MAYLPNESVGKLMVSTDSRMTWI